MKSQTNKSKNDPSGVFHVSGWSAAAEYLSNCPERVRAVHLEEGSSDEFNSRINKVVGPSFRAPISIVQDGKIEGKIKIFVELKVLSEKKIFETIEDQDIVLVVDHITDPRNLGAIVRSCAFFGVKLVIAPRNRQVGLTNASVSTAKGGFALAQLGQVVNLKRCLERLKNAGFWVIGADMDGEPASKFRGFYSKVALVLGSEDTGLTHGVRGYCDRIVSIPSGATAVDSLNVSVAAGVLLYEFTGRL